MAYFQIDPAKNAINGEFACPQIGNPNYIELPETDARVVAWRNPPVPVPSVSASQAKIQLLRSGLLDAVKAAVASADAETQLWFDEAATWHPDNAHVLALATQLGISPDQKAALFTSASAIV